MTTNLTDHQAPVTDEELDQMIWKLERDGGMTPKLLSLMRELREVRKAKGEPVGYIDAEYASMLRDGDIDKCRVYKDQFYGSLPLYLAPPAPVVLEEMTACKAYDLLMEKGGVMSPVDSFVCAWNACRAAMCATEKASNHGVSQGEYSENCATEPVQNGATHAPVEVQSVDHVDGESLASIEAAPVLDSLPKIAESRCGMNAEKLNQSVSKTNLAATQIKPVADLYGITSPTGSETTFTFDAGEASRFADSGWSVQEYVELERYQEAMVGNSPATPDGWMMVPMRLTAENGAKGVLSGEFSETKFVNCPECFGDDECETCDGSGRIEITVPVTWTTIKTVWSKGVEHFATAAPKEVG